MSARFGTSARKWENGFVRLPNCFVALHTAKQSWRNCASFQNTERAGGSEPLLTAHRPLLCRFQAFSPAGENR